MCEALCDDDLNLLTTAFAMMMSYSNRLSKYRVSPWLADSLLL